MQKKLKMRTGASTKPAVKADAPKACIERETEKDDLKGINPHFLYKPAVNHYRPFAKKAAVVPKETLPDIDFKAMDKLHAEKIVAVNRAYMLRQAKAAKEAEEKKKLAEAERKKNHWKNMSFENLTSRQMNKAILAFQDRVMDRYYE
jgi:hypothetical protein